MIFVKVFIQFRIRIRNGNKAGSVYILNWSQPEIEDTILIRIQQKILIRITKAVKKELIYQRHSRF
jgi:hypothetical protein